MIKKILVWLACFIASTANAQQFTAGQILTAAQLNTAFAAVLPIAGGTLTGPLTVPTLNVANATITGGTITGLSAPIPIGSGGTNAMTATGATSSLQYLQGAVGSAARSLTSKLSDVVSAMDFAGVDPTGSTDSTTGLQAWLNSGSKSLYLPQGNYKYTSLTIPATVGLTIFGDGPKSCLMQNGTGIKYPTQASTVFPTLGTIRDLCFDGTNGSGHTLDTTYSQNTDLLNLTFFNPPTNFAALKMDGNPTSSTYMHDMRVKNIRIYNNASLASNAGIELGSFASDTSIDGFIGNGNFATKYMLLADNGAQTTAVSNSHPYNAAINVVRLSGNNNDFSWTNVIVDNANNDVFYSLNSNKGRFSNVWFEAVKSGYSGIVFDGSSNNTIVGGGFSAASGAISAARELNSSSGNRVILTSLNSVSNYSSPFNLTGSGSGATDVKIGNTLITQDSASLKSPTIAAAGVDSSIGININPKGTGPFSINFPNSTATFDAYSDAASEVAIEAFNTTTPGTKFNINLAKYGGRVLIGGTDNGVDKLQVNGSLKLGSGAVIPGFTSLGNQTQWLKAIVSCSTDCAQTWSQSTGGGSGLLGATRSSDNTLAGSMAAQGVAGYAINDNTAQVQTVYAGYFEARRAAGAGTTQGNEIDVVNQGSVVGLDPYNMFSTGTTPGMWISSGRPDVTTSAANASAAIGVINNNTAFENGLVFHSTALNTTSGEGNAIVLPQKDAVVWFGSAGNKVAAIRSDATTGSLRMIFANGQMVLQDLSGNTKFSFTSTGNFSTAGGIDATGIGANTPSTGKFTTLSSTGTGAMPLYSTTGAGVNAPHMVQGSVALSSGSATVTLSGSAVFSTSSSYMCTASDTTAANAVKVSQGSGTSITFTGTGTDTVQFLCAGN
ncbi:hypothetical protein [Burkholderia metallica]|uniref:hypothetical protein n=1 Tax=Burkholderia metallica TaxID=488729 RepID=UPI0020C5E7FB|nr:hypothetical protein [Burkholderia metallica]